MNESKSDAHEMDVGGLLNAAARLVEKALLKLDMEEAPCPHCTTRLFRDREQGRIYEMLTDTPDRLRKAALRFEWAVKIGNKPSIGYGVASRRKQEDTGNARPSSRS